MYIDTSYFTSSGKQYVRHLLRESYREDGKVKKRTIASLNHCSEDEIQAMKLALKHKGNLSALGSIKDVETSQGKSIGALHVIQSLAKQLGILDGLGRGEEGKRAFWQIYSRLVAQGSRQTSIRLRETHETRLVEKFPSIHEKALYKNLAWLSEQQESIEKRLFKNRKISHVFLYDVTSSYLEGQKNELSAYGYNRDGKYGKKQMVIGLLTDELGIPVAVRVFEGNTSDTCTFGDQITILKEKFGIDNVIIVGDGGMIKTPQSALLPEDYSYITSISKPQIKKLIKQGVIQMELFDTTLCEVSYEGLRYIFRRNLIRKEELELMRLEKESIVLNYIEEQNCYLKAHKRASIKVALRKIEAKISSRKLNKWFTVQVVDGVIQHEINQAARTEASKLDGCYCMKTDVDQSIASKEVVHDRYKDLAKVESAFRTIKTGHLEIRPVYLRKKEHTKGHVFVVMLAYIIELELARGWKKLGIPVQEGIANLANYSSILIKPPNRKEAVHIPKANKFCKKLIAALGIKATIKIRQQG